MIVEERDYRIKAGRLADFVATYERLGLPIQKEELGGFIGYFTTEIGELNHTVALWRYDSLADRDVRRARMLARPDWSTYLKAIDGMIDIQTNRILKPTSFSPIA
jgi:hypothetical protein